MRTSAENSFAFGDNWKQFLKILNDEHIAEAQHSLTNFLNTTDLTGKKFLDIGSGSGLHSLVACRLGAIVHSFDYDEQSVACTRQLKNRYFRDNNEWIVQQGSVLDHSYISSLGTFDICYAWGVLHHTGVLWQALYNAQLPLKKDGLLFIAIYNDQGIISSIWNIIKKTYCGSNLGKVLMTLIFYPAFFFAGLLIDLLHFQNPLARYQEHKKYRGMSLIVDWRDWLGGYPYEPAKPNRIISFYQNLGFELIRFEPTGHGFGNNQFLFRKTE